MSLIFAFAFTSNVDENGETFMMQASFMRNGFAKITATAIIAKWQRTERASAYLH